MAKTKMPTPHKLPGGKYRCQVMVNGKRISATHEDPDMAQALVISMKAGIIEKEKGKNSVTLDAAITDYINSCSNVLSPSTIRGYENIRKNHFPALMKMKVTEISKRDLQNAANEESATMSPKTVENCCALVVKVLKEYGVTITDIKIKQKIKKKITYLSADEIATLIDALVGNPYEIQLLLAIWLGLRQSEIHGLCWDCVDFENSSVTIMRTLVPDKDHKWVLKDGAKNVMSQRTVDCPGYIMNKLKSIHQEGATGRVFTTDPRTALKHLHSVCKENNITDTTVHGLRHTNAAVMIKLGVADQYAMARNGWSSEQTFKKVYGYLFNDDARETDEKVNDFFQGLVGG